MPSSPSSPSSPPPPPLTPPLPSNGDCHVIAKRWHINGAPLQESFLLMSLHKTIRRSGGRPWRRPLSCSYGGTAWWSPFSSASGDSLTYFPPLFPFLCDSPERLCSGRQASHKCAPSARPHTGEAHRTAPPLFTHDAAAETFPAACFHEERRPFARELIGKLLPLFPFIFRPRVLFQVSEDASSGEKHV